MSSAIILKGTMPDNTADVPAVSSGALSSSLSPDEGVTVPRLSLKETGYVGLKTSNGAILHEAQRSFSFPQFHKVIAEMRANPTVFAAMNAYRFLMTRPTWYVKPPIGADENMIAKAKFVETVMADMEDSWENFIHSVVPYLEYGHSIHNIVPYRRLSRNGSKHNDGLVGIRKLAIRNQESIVKWRFSEDGRDLIAVEQSIQQMENGYLYATQANENGLITLPRDSFLLFTASATAGNPQGNSLYKGIYLSFKQLTMLQDQQLLSIAKNVMGILKIEVPAAYLAGESAPDGGAAAASFRTIIDSYNAGQARGFLFPQQIDPESKLNMFSYSLMDQKGSPQNDVESIIKGLQNDICQALSVDVLRLGSDGTGSFSLASAKTSILALAIESRLKEIKGVLNSHLMRFLFEMNGWSTEVMPTFECREVEDVDMDTFSAYFQRIAAVGGIEYTRDVLNRVREVGGFPLMPDDMPVDTEILSTSITGKESGSGQGLAVGANGSGTAKNPSKSDTSIANKENAA